jgi:hypothetical protein
MIKGGEKKELKNKIIVTTIAMIILIAATTTQLAKASIPGNLGSGYDAGKAAALYDFYHGTRTRCTSSSFAYCAAFGYAYEVELGHLRSAFSK